MGVAYKQARSNVHCAHRCLLKLAAVSKAMPTLKVSLVQECRWATSRGYAAKSARDTLQRDTFKVGIALLTAASSSADNGVTVRIR